MNKKQIAVLVTILLQVPYISCAADKLLQKGDFTYLGAFRVPKSDMGGPLYQGLPYGGSVIAYNYSNNSLFIVGHDSNQQIGEISIPEIKNTADINELNTASVIQNLVDITEGNRLNLKVGGGAIEVNGTKIGGLIRYGDKLIGSAYAYYDGGYDAVRSHFKSGLTTTTVGDFEGMFEVGSKPDPVPQAGFVGGYMTPIPVSWQALLGGKVLTGMSTLSVLGRTSSGPAAFAFDPDQLTGTTPAPAGALLYYPITHQTIGTYYSSQTLYNKGSHQSGIIFPPGTQSVIFTGKQGVGEACYGPGTNNLEEQWNRYDDPSPNNTCMGIPMTDTADPCCYDPVNLEKGAHAYPYVDYMWAYDADDFVRVKMGGRIVDNPSPNLVDGVPSTSTETYKPWHIKPYASWELSLPYQQNRYHIFGGASAYDDTTNRLYIVQVQADVGGYAMWPIIHVYEINKGITSPTINNIIIAK